MDIKVIQNFAGITMGKTEIFEELLESQKIILGA